ncbi:hypothetical protein EDD15DRAFT_2202776 [Pisolithus albus]|nr:hypothetical protein EDD15DRAFT_2202776 [Pisolithus albus]
MPGIVGLRLCSGSHTGIHLWPHSPSFDYQPVTGQPPRVACLCPQSRTSFMKQRCRRVTKKRSRFRTQYRTTSYARERIRVSVSVKLGRVRSGGKNGSQKFRQRAAPCIHVESHHGHSVWGFDGWPRREGSQCCANHVMVTPDTLSVTPKQPRPTQYIGAGLHGGGSAHTCAVSSFGYIIMYLWISHIDTTPETYPEFKTFYLAHHQDVNEKCRNFILDDERASYYGFYPLHYVSRNLATAQPDEHGIDSNRRKVPKKSISFFGLGSFRGQENATLFDGGTNPVCQHIGQGTVNVYEMQNVCRGDHNTQSTGSVKDLVGTDHDDIYASAKTEPFTSMNYEKLGAPDSFEHDNPYIIENLPSYADTSIAVAQERHDRHPIRFDLRLLKDSQNSWSITGFVLTAGFAVAVAFRSSAGLLPFEELAEKVDGRAQLVLFFLAMPSLRKERGRAVVWLLPEPFEDGRGVFDSEIGASLARRGSAAQPRRDSGHHDPKKSRALLSSR